MSNIAEGFERGGDQEFIQHLAMAKGSCGETRSQLYVALDQGYLAESAFQNLSSEAEQVSRMIAGFMNYLEKSPLRGSKYKSRCHDTLDLGPWTLDLGLWTLDFGPHR